MTVTPAHASAAAAVRAAVTADAGAARLSRLWARRPGLLGRLATTHHRDVGARLVSGALAAFALALALALLVRLQLALPGARIVGPEAFGQVVTAHGSLMLLLFALPAMLGIAVYVLPAQIGARADAFPGLAALGAWLFLGAGVLLFAALALNVGAAQGWYVLGDSPSRRLELWPQSATLAAAGAFAASLDLLATAATRRARGMTPSRIPVFVWATIVASLFGAIAMPVAAAAGLTLAIGVPAGVAPALFDLTQGDGPLLYQHAFPLFAQLAMPVCLLLAAGIVSQIVETLARRPLVGHTAVVVALAASGALALLLWVPHVAPARAEVGLRVVHVLLLAPLLPAGIVFGCWTVTLWSGRPRLRAPLIFSAAAIAVLAAGGVTAALLGTVALGPWLAGTQFAVAHTHLLAVGGVVLPLVAALAYWFPKWSGRLLEEPPARTACWLLLLGIAAGFGPLVRLGLLGMPARIYTYGAGEGWGGWNALATLGMLLIAAALLLLWVTAVRSLTRGLRVGPNPWEAATLEWSEPSPPPRYGVLALPVVTHRYPLWAAGPAGGGPPGTDHLGWSLGSEQRWALVTTVWDAEPSHATLVPDGSLWPATIAVLATVTLALAVPYPVAIPLGVALIALAAVGWAAAAQRVTA